MTVKTIEEIVSAAFDLFNSIMNTSYSFQNVKLAYFNAQDADKVHREFCEKNFPDHLNERHDLANAAASAFAGETVDGIMIRNDVSINKEEFIRIILHELAHIFCVHNEIPNGNFYKSYCDGTADDTVLDGVRNAGYAIWREFVADFLSTNAQGIASLPMLSDIKPTIMKHSHQIRFDNPNAKLNASLFLVNLMFSKEASFSWERVNVWLNKTGLSDLIGISHQVYSQICKERFWEITIDFIETLGNTYLLILSQRAFAK